MTNSAAGWALSCSIRSPFHVGVRPANNALAAAGTKAAELGPEALGSVGLVYEGLHVLGQGAVLAGIVLGAMVTFILEKQLFRGACRGDRGSPVLDRAAARRAGRVGCLAGVALGYLFLAVVLAALGLSQRASREPEVEEPVEATEAAVG